MIEMSKNKIESRPFGIKDKLGYMFGDFGNDFTFIFAASYLMVFYIKVLGLSGAIVGTIFLVSRVLDAFTDVGMGRIVDTLKPAKDGRFRPWIRRMAIPVALASALMYLYFAKDWSYNVKVVYAFVTYLLWGSICYTGINIPYGSMAAVISSNPEDRASLSTFRSLGATFAGLLIGMLTPLLIYTTDAAGNQIVIPERFTIIGFVFGVLAVLCYAICYFSVTERVQVTPQKSEEKASVADIVNGLFSNRALIAMIGAALLILLASLLTQSMNMYLFMDYFKNTKVMAIISLLSVASILALAPFASKISKKFGKKEAGGFSVLIASICYFIMYLGKISNVKIFIVLLFIASLGVGFFSLITWAFITDVIDYQEVKTNKREDGTVYAVYSFSRKLGQALAGGIGGFALSAIGYISGASAQTKEVADKIYSICTLVPAVCYLGVFLVLFFMYPLSKKVVEENTIELNKRHAEK